MYQFATCSEENILAHFNTSVSTGLSSGEAEIRIQSAGYNEISVSVVPWWEIAARQFKSAFIYLLLAAAAIVLLVGEYLDAGVILCFVFINAALGFIQEFKSEQSLRALQQYVRPKSRVKRDGQWHSVDARFLVPGDIIRLETGDITPADLRILIADRITVNETILTGESVPVTKHAGALVTVPGSVYESQNLVFSSTSIVGGSATALVIETGTRTMMGSLAKLTVETTKESEFSKGISKFSRFILKMTFVTLIFVFVANLLIKGSNADIIELVVFSIALVVSVVPEALPVVTTVSLSRGALQLAKQDVVVKRLTAIEDIGSIEVLCSDKTGTLTENTLHASGTSPGAHPDLLHYATMTVADIAEKNEPFDIAIMEAAGRGAEKEGKNLLRVAEIPFDPERRRNAVLLKDTDETFLLVRGAPEVVMGLSEPLPEPEQRVLSSWALEKGRSGERTIAIGKRVLRQGTTAITPEDEHGLELMGMLSFTDPIKPSAFRAVEKASHLGVSLKIITGDSPEVAGSVGFRIGLISDPSHVVTGESLTRMSPEERENAIIRYPVIARVSPEQKYEIIKTLQRTTTVGFLGEGINDAPALKLAGVSLAVDSAADIAREASDIILLQKNLEVIIEGIRSGRAVFANSVKYLKATLASNFGNFYAIAIGSLFITFLPMLPIQILLLNLLSDFPMISIATDTVDEKEIEKPRSYDLREILLIATLLGVVSTVFDFMFFAVFMHQEASVLQTNWFIGSILTELLFLFSIRSRLPFLKASRPSGYVLVLTAIAVAITLVLPYSAAGQTVFHFTPPSAGSLAIIFCITGAFFICVELVKNLFYRYAS
jgi:Mg2+-importing ATPase